MHSFLGDLWEGIGALVEDSCSNLGVLGLRSASFAKTLGRADPAFNSLTRMAWNR